MYFIGIQLLPAEKEETYFDAARIFIQAAGAEGVKFHRAIIYGPLDVGKRKLIRIQTDCPNYPPIVKYILAMGRCVAAPTKGGYRVFLPDGKDAPISASQMQAVARPGYGQIYRGPSVPLWERQFQK